MDNVCGVHFNVLTNYGYCELCAAYRTVEAKDQQIRELEAQLELLEGYTHHKVGCKWNSKPVARINEFEVIRQPCSCGLNEALKETT